MKILFTTPAPNNNCAFSLRTITKKIFRPYKERTFCASSLSLSPDIIDNSNSSSYTAYTPPPNLRANLLIYSSNKWKTLVQKHKDSSSDPTLTNDCAIENVIGILSTALVIILVTTLLGYGLYSACKKNNSTKDNDIESDRGNSIDFTPSSPYFLKLSQAQNKTEILEEIAPLQTIAYTSSA